MEVYLASPNTQQQAEHCGDMNVLLSFASFSPWIVQYQASFERVLIDSGAFSELNSGKKIDIEAYRDFSERWIGRAEAIAGLDDISGDYNRSLKNYERIKWSFPTWHDSDPLELMDDLVAIAQERKTWIGIGMVPPRTGKEIIIRTALDRVPSGVHVHGWALRAYTHLTRLDSVDSTNWWRDAMGLRKNLPWLHYGECLDLVIKRYKRETRQIRIAESSQASLFA
jgi:hypothetical protein